MAGLREITIGRPLNAKSRTNGHVGDIASGIELERIHERRTAQSRRQATKARLFTAGAVVIALLLCAALAMPVILAMNASDKTMLASPLGTIGDVSWVNMTPPSSPGARWLSAFAFDPPTDSFILFGGYDNDYDFLNDTWSYNHGSNLWQNMLPESHPDFAPYPTCTYDPVDGVILLYPATRLIGYTMGPAETWSYDASSNAWENLNATNTPPLRLLCSAAYDVQSDKLILFGGTDVYTFIPVNETWAYDFTSNTWTEMTPANPPPAQMYQTMVYDSESDVIVMYGGAYDDGMGNPVFIENPWAYDYDTDMWVEMEPPVSPPERFAAANVYDPVSDLMLTFGGATPAGQRNDMWAYDYNADSWTEITELVKPPERAVALMAIDPDNRVIVLHGGLNNMSGDTVILGDTWSVQLGAPIPEFQTVVLPAVGLIAIVAVLAVLRRREH